MTEIENIWCDKVHPSGENGSHFMAITGFKASKAAAILRNGHHPEVEVAHGKFKRNLTEIFMLVSTVVVFYKCAAL